MIRPVTFLAWAALYAGAAFGCLVESGVLAHARTPDLALLPHRAGPFELQDELPVEAEALGEQPPEAWTFRRVRDADGNEGRMFVAYYERAQRWSGRPHDVERCYAALGWQELDKARLAEAHRPWSRRFARDGAEIRVVHWIERPGPDDDRLAWGELARRLGSVRGFRPDVASVYFEFPSEHAPDDASFAAAVAGLSDALEQLW